MNNEITNAEQRLQQISVEKLSPVEREGSWQKIVMKHREQPVVSPWSWMLFVHSRVAVTVATLVIIVAGGGTVAVADSAKPGDALFVLDRAAESVRLVLASSDAKSDVQLAFAHERLAELDEIIIEESAKRFAFAPEASEESRPAVPSFGGISALQKAETAADQLQESENARMAVLDDSALDTSANSAPTPVDGDASATLMMAQETPITEEAQLSDESIAKISEGLENAIINLEEVAVALDEKENVQAREVVAAAADRLEEKLFNLPVAEQDKFRARIERIRGYEKNKGSSAPRDSETKVDDGGLEYTEGSSTETYSSDGEDVE